MEARLSAVETAIGRFDRLDGRMDGFDRRMDVLDGRIDGLDRRMDRLDLRMDGIDARLRDVERTLTELSAKMDLLVSQILAKLPSWWQMPAVIGATVVLLVALYGGVRYLQAHGFL